MISIMQTKLKKENINITKKNNINNNKNSSNEKILNNINNKNSYIKVKNNKYDIRNNNNNENKIGFNNNSQMRYVNQELYSSVRQRLNINPINISINSIQVEGNCLFRSISRFIYGMDELMSMSEERYTLKLLIELIHIPILLWIQN